MPVHLVNKHRKTLKTGNYTEQQKLLRKVGTKILSEKIQHIEIN